MRKHFAIALFLIGGLMASVVAYASRNSSGTYTLPAGNPVVSGSTISSTWANSTLSDLATEVTSSLDRSGRGCMLAPTQVTNGTVSLPSLTFCTDLDTGLYRIGANNPGMSAGGVNAQSWAATAPGSTFPLGATATQSTSNTVAFSATGNGTAQAATFTGGSSDGVGITATGGGNGAGMQMVGGGTGVGGFASNGTAATGATRRDAFRVTNGDINLDGVANPDSTVSIINRLTPKNLLKAWIYARTGASASTFDAFNVSSTASNSTTINVGQDFANANYSVVCTAEDVPYFVTAGAKAVGSWQVAIVNSTTGVAIDPSATQVEFNCHAYGVQ